MKRRRLLQLGLGTAVVLAVAGGSMALVQPGLQNGALTARSRAIFSAVALAVLDGSLPAEPAARAAALKAHLDRVNTTILGLPPAVQKELSLLLALLGTAAGRVAMTGLGRDWSEAAPSQVQAALQSMRLSSIAARQQVYLALRELTNGAYFADPSTWPLLHYPGPNPI